MDNSRNEKTYLLALITEQKKYSRSLEEKIKEEALWKSRIQLAGDSGRSDLADAAQQKAAECAVSIQSIRQHLASLELQIRDQRQVAADAGLDDGRIISREGTEAMVSQLEEAAGLSPGDATDPDIIAAAEARRMEAELQDADLTMELEALKKKLNGGG
jgi:hypothetical protein